MVALYALTAAHALLKALNVEDERGAAAENAYLPLSIKRAAHATVNRDFFMPVTPYWPRYTAIRKGAVSLNRETS
jgi:hypothetical protein